MTKKRAKTKAKAKASPKGKAGPKAKTPSQAKAGPKSRAKAKAAPKARAGGWDLVLVDGSSYLFRAFHALPPLVSSKGRPTGAVKGVINMIRSLLKAQPQAGIAIVFDAKGDTFRNRIYPEYKAHRPPMPPELRAQIAPIHEVIRAMGLPLLIIDDVEADDVIGSLAVQAAAAGTSTLISTGDKDLAQLVNDKVTLINTMNDETLDSAGVERKFGVRPERIIDYLALMGDKSDNIPGVPGVGPKTAVKWLQEYDSMEGIIANAEKIGGKIGEALRANLDQLKLSYELATIKTDVKLSTDIASLVPGEKDKERLYALFTDLEFKTWLNELIKEGVDVEKAESLSVTAAADDGDTATAATDKTAATADKDTAAAPHIDAPNTDYRCITTEPEFDRWLSTLQSRIKNPQPGDTAPGDPNNFPRIALSVEHTEGHFLQQSILGLAFAVEPGKAVYIPLGHAYVGCPAQLNADKTLERLRPLLEDPAITKQGWDLKHSLHLLHNQGIALQPIKSDVLLASYVLNSVSSRHSLADIARNHLGVTLKDIDALLGKGRGKLSRPQLPIEQFAPLAAERADYILRLSRFLEHKMTEVGQLAGLYRYYEIPLIEVLQRIERNGIKVAPEELRRQSHDLAGQLEKLEQEVFAVAGEEFNLGSPRQLQVILYDKMQLPKLKKTKTGQASTAEPVLQELAADYELPRLILEHRSLSKLKSTYTDKLPLEINPGSGRIHTSLQQAVAATGRLSSVDPNLQNIPIRTEAGRRVRQAFVCEPGYKMMTADYSQVELRIMAHLSRDEGLLEAFSKSADVHQATAAEVFNTPLDEVSPEQRRRAKAINFGLIYGMSAFGLANQLQIERREAQKYVERYFENYPGVRRYMDETQSLATENGYVETLFGRRLYLPDIRAGNAVMRKAAQRTAINAPMQGSAADIIKRAMIDIDHWLALGDLDARMLLQVHDELIFEVQEADLDLLIEGVKFRMTTAAALDVPLVVGIGIGDDWEQAH